MSAAKFGRLTVLGQASHRSADGRVMWELRCDCGTELTRPATSVKSGNTKSCGCLKSESTVARNKAQASQRGLSNTKVYKAWSSMKERCYTPTHQAWKDYGGRGITVCERWRGSFQNFLEDMGTPEPGMSLDRKDVNGNYEPSNCRWATMTKQNNNRRSNTLITHDGRTQTLAEWSREVGVPPKTLRHRIKAGWEIGKALFAKVSQSENSRWSAAA